VFGGSLGSSSFAGFGGSKSGLPSFATPGQTAITGLSSKPATTFGTQQKDAESDDDEGSGGEDDAANDGNEETDSKFKLESGPGKLTSFLLTSCANVCDSGDWRRRRICCVGRTCQTLHDERGGRRKGVEREWSWSVQIQHHGRRAKKSAVCSSRRRHTSFNPERRGSENNGLRRSPRWKARRRKALFQHSNSRRQSRNAPP
jgi:hypothetical protein